MDKIWTLGYCLLQNMDKIIGTTVLYQILAENIGTTVHHKRTNNITVVVAPFGHRVSVLVHKKKVEVRVLDFFHTQPSLP